MKDIKYIEQKTGYNDDGPAWIGKVRATANGKTIYFNGKAFSKSGGQGIQGNYYDIETGDEYWISGIKKNGNDGWGDSKPKVKIEESIVKEYLEMREMDKLSSRFSVFIPKETDVEKFNLMANKKLKED